MTDLPSVADLPVYGQSWTHEEERLQWERAVGAALLDLAVATPAVVLADDGETGVRLDVGLSVDPDGADRLGSFALSTTSQPFGDNGTVFAEVGDTRAIVFVGALAAQTVAMLDLQDSAGHDLFVVTPGDDGTTEIHAYDSGTQVAVYRFNKDGLAVEMTPNGDNHSARQLYVNAAGIEGHVFDSGGAVAHEFFIDEQDGLEFYGWSSGAKVTSILASPGSIGVAVGPNVDSSPLDALVSLSDSGVEVLAGQDKDLALVTSGTGKVTYNGDEVATV